MSLSSGAREYVLAFADDEHMIGARHTSWIGLGPFLEEDLAFCSIAQDELGHAIALYRLLVEDGHDLDTFALMRQPGDYRSCWFSETECGDWNDALVRHWLYDRAESLRWRVLEASSHEPLREVAARATREEAFHLAHAEQFMSRIAATDPEPIIDAIDRLLPVALGMWDPVSGEDDVVAGRVASAPSAHLAEQWADMVRDDLIRWNLDVGWPVEGNVADRQRHRTVRSAGFDELHAGLQRVVVLDPSAVW